MNSSSIQTYNSLVNSWLNVSGTVSTSTITGSQTFLSGFIGGWGKTAAEENKDLKKQKAALQNQIASLRNIIEG